YYLVPWNALFAEFSDDYVERSSILTDRSLCVWIGGMIFTTAVWTFIFPTTAESPGQLNPAAYHLFAPVLAICIGIAAFLTTHLTRREVPYLLQSVEGKSFSFGQVFRDLRLAFGNRDYVALVIAVLGFSAIAGADGALEIYMQTYFWGLVSEDIRWFALTFIGSLAAFMLITPLARRLQQKQLPIGVILVLPLHGGVVW